MVSAAFLPVALALKKITELYAGRTGRQNLLSFPGIASFLHHLGISPGSLSNLGLPYNRVFSVKHIYIYLFCFSFHVGVNVNKWAMGDVGNCQVSLLLRELINFIQALIGKRLDY
jgi:hypothetical protein